MGKKNMHCKNDSLKLFIGSKLIHFTFFMGIQIIIVSCPYGKSYNGAHTLSISCTKSVISCKALIFFLMQGFKAIFFHHIVIVSDINYHNMVKKYCILMYTI